MSSPQASPHILVVDDEQTILESVEIALRYEGYDVVTALDAASALQRFRDREPSAVILDVMLPDLDGFILCRQLREVSHVPILMLTARDDLDDRVRGLDSGADDYLSKPFRLKELLARVRALLRRAGTFGGDSPVSFEDVLLDRRSRRVTRGGRPVELTAREFDLLDLFLRNPRRVLTKESILHHLWGWDIGDTNVVEVHVSALRAKLLDTERSLIRTVRGAGYVLGG